MKKSSMPQYSRVKTCGVQKQGSDYRVVSGILEDELYAMECEICVHWPELTIKTVNARMKRFTTERCLLAEKFFRACEGWQIDSEIDGRIKKELGRNGCRHMAILIVDCLHSLARAELARDLQAALSNDTGLDRKEFLNSFLRRNPGLVNYLKIQ